MYEVGKDGRTPYQRLKGHKLTSNMIEFTEGVHFLPPKHLDNGKAEIRWRDGVFLGLKLTSGEKLVGTPEGVLKVRTVRRKLESKRWDARHIEALTSFPWKPCIQSEDDKVLIRPPVAIQPSNADKQEVQLQRDTELAPRTLSIQRKDLVKYGCTPSCPGCYAAANDRKHRAHTADCRARIEKEMLEDARR